MKKFWRSDKWKLLILIPTLATIGFPFLMPEGQTMVQWALALWAVLIGLMTFVSCWFLIGFALDDDQEVGL